METTADFVHLQQVSRAPNARTSGPTAGLIHARYVTAGVLTAGYLATIIACFAAWGAAALPMFLVPLPLAMLLIWASPVDLRSDERRALTGR